MTTRDRDHDDREDRRMKGPATQHPSPPLRVTAHRVDRTQDGKDEEREQREHGDDNENMGTTTRGDDNDRDNRGTMRRRTMR